MTRHALTCPACAPTAARHGLPITRGTRRRSPFARSVAFLFWLCVVLALSLVVWSAIAVIYLGACLAWRIPQC